MKKRRSPWFRPAVLFFTAPGLASAATQTWWDAGPSNSWTTSAANWDAGSVWTNGNDAVFGGAGETIEVDSTVTFRNLTFQTGGYTIADATNNGTLTLTANGTISTAAGTTTISEAIGGAFGLTKTGDGTLLLTASNGYTGTTTVSGGKLTLGFSLISSNVVNSSSNLALAGGKLELSSAAVLGLNSQTFNATSFTAGTGSQVIMTQNGLGTLSLDLGSITRNARSAVDFDTLEGTIAIANGTAGSMLRSSNGQAYATVNGGADWAAATSITLSTNERVVAFSSVGSYTANTAGGFTNNANIDIASGIDTTVSADTSVATLRFNVNQARTVTVGSGANLTVTGGILITGSSNAAGGATFTGGNLRAGSTAQELVIHNYGGTGLTIGSAIVDNAGASALTLAGTGVTTLTGANTFTGPTAVLGGTLAVNSGAQFGSATTVNNGATLAGDGTFGGAVSVAGTLSPGATAGTSAGTVTFQNGLALTASGHVSWQLNANSTSGGDMVSITGGSFTAATGAMVDLAFGGSVNFGNVFWDSARQWTVVDLNGATDGVSGGALALGTITGGTGSYASEGSFSLLNQSGDQVLAWTPTAVPEPSAALLGGFGLLAMLRRRR